MLTTHYNGQVLSALRGVAWRAEDNFNFSNTCVILLESSCNVMAHGDARDGK